MNPAALLALISDLYAQVTSQQAEIAALRERLAQQPEPPPAAGTVADPLTTPPMGPTRVPQC